MKHRKRQFLIAVVIALTILLLFVGCKHAHQFEEAWQTNDNQHWKPCKCGEQDALSFHADENGNTNRISADRYSRFGLSVVFRHS